MLPYAHAGHYAVWILYALPILIVVGAIVRNALAHRHQQQEDEEGR